LDRRAGIDAADDGVQTGFALADSVSQLAYSEAVRAVDDQAKVLDNLRGRAGTLIAAASLVTSFLGGQVLAKPTLTNGSLVRAHIDAAGWIALGAFVLLACLMLVILLPYNWRLVMSPAVILQGANFEETRVELAGYHENNYDENAKKLRPLFRVFILGCLALVVETVAWIVDLGF
jgi:hypothetical protein